MMKAKLLFLVCFVSVHAFLTLTVMHQCYNPPAGGHSALFKLLAAVTTTPLLLPLVMFDPDGERLPEWVQYISLPLNSLIWGLGLLLAFVLIKRWRTSRRAGLAE